ncbi:hypothetical protein [uncultured Microbulbifer sp.]|uniref:hypothetical protein n=1 Tax=uncultured Microbulbifer sp. TaxID=348147 RepID=UPI00262B1C2C|nr:hypothetical protein [uncultured Microbulbifer sp.]
MWVGSSILLINFSNIVAADKISNNVLEGSHINSLRSIAQRSLANSNISTSDIVQLANRSIFQVEEFSESIQVSLSVDGTSTSIVSEKAENRPNHISIALRVADANYNIEINTTSSNYIIHGYDSKLGVEGKLLLYITLASMEKSGWRESENSHKSELYRITNWLSEMPAGMVIHTINSRNRTDESNN